MVCGKEVANAYWIKRPYWPKRTIWRANAFVWKGDDETELLMKISWEH
jgi:hypothetical protein